MNSEETKVSILHAGKMLLLTGVFQKQPFLASLSEVAVPGSSFINIR